MWAGVFLALLAIAGVATYVFVVLEEAVVFTTAIASACWALLAVSGGTIEVVSDGSTVVVSAGAGQYVFAALAVLSLAAFTGTLIGWYPDDPDIHDPEYRP